MNAPYLLKRFTLHAGHVALLKTCLCPKQHWDEHPCFQIVTRLPIYPLGWNPRNGIARDDACFQAFHTQHQITLEVKMYWLAHKGVAC